MHIPDGYLSPSTCAALYASSAPFWYLALKRTQRLLHTRLVPLISVFAAFSFVIMMFNLPLPGGTTGHAVGMGIAAVVLGPWGAMLAVSVALMIQALFFGDGGITAIGANCFNMAIVGSLVAYWTYYVLSGNAPLTSPRRVLAAGVGGYVAINVAALLAAIEFGLQPALFTDASGAPLYCPYPLHIAIPAMMIGHVTIAGLAEAICSGGIVAYLQRADVALLKLTAPGARAEGSENAEGSESAARELARQGGWRATRPLWMGMALLMILSPLGLLAAGTAWGEWAPEDFQDPVARREITAASGNHPAPEQPPRGLARLSSLWTAPIPDYAPSFLKSEPLGYILSAVFGIGLILLLFLLISRMVPLPGRRQPDNVSPTVDAG